MAATPPSPQRRVPDVARRDEQIAGHRVVRTLSSSAERRTLLVHDLEGMPVIARHWRRHDARADHEVAALDRAQGDHVIRLLDIGSTGDGGLAALLKRCPRGDLAALLRDRDAFSAGELVTLVAPLAQAISRLHDAGVAHGRLSAQRVLFDVSGAPQLAGFGSAELFDAGLPPAHLERVDGVLDDRAAMTALAAAIAERVPGGAGRRARTLVDDAALDADDPLGALARGLFALASGSPIRFPVDAVSDAPGESTTDGETLSAGSRAVAPGSLRHAHASPPARATDDSPARERRAAAAPRRGRRGRRRLDPSAATRTSRRPRKDARPSRTAVAALVPHLLDGAPIGEISRRVRSGLARLTATRGGRVGAAVGATALLTGIALIAIPGPSSSDAVGVSSVTARPDARSSAPASGGSSSANESRDAADDGDATALSGQAAVSGPDALAATEALLTTRTECLRELDRTCLAAISEPGSSARRDDLGLLARLDAGEATDADRRRVALEALSVEGDLGGAVVILLAPDSEPASLLVMRGEAGWRIRTYQGAAG